MNPLLSRSLLVTAAAVCLASCAGPGGSSAPVDARTQEVLSAMSAKLTSTQTLRFRGTRTAPSGFHAAVDLGSNTQMTGALRRPNQILVDFNSSEGKRTLAYTGSEVILVDYKAGSYIRSPAPSTGEGVLRSFDATLDFVPPAAEFLTSNPQSYLMEGVTSVQYKGQETVGGVVCDHIFFQQKNRSRDLWVAQSDRLPRRITITYPNDGATPIAITTAINSWQLNAPVSDADLAPNIPANSEKLDYLKLKR